MFLADSKERYSSFLTALLHNSVINKNQHDICPWHLAVIEFMKTNF